MSTFEKFDAALLSSLACGVASICSEWNIRVVAVRGCVEMGSTINHGGRRGVTARAVCAVVERSGAICWFG